MYETVWNKVINDREIDLINEDSFDKDVAALATSGGDIIGLENFKTVYARSGVRGRPRERHCSAGCPAYRPRSPCSGGDCGF